MQTNTQPILDFCALLNPGLGVAFATSLGWEGRVQTNLYCSKLDFNYCRKLRQPQCIYTAVPYSYRYSYSRSINCMVYITQIGTHLSDLIQH